MNGFERVRFITSFKDYTDPVNTYMYHCHILSHEDAGMMGQFLVVDRVTGLAEESILDSRMRIYPNPATDRLHLEIDDLEGIHGELSVRIMAIDGKWMGEDVVMNSRNSLIPVDQLQAGLYVLQVLSDGEPVGKSLFQKY